MLQQASTDVIQLWSWVPVLLTFISSMMASIAGMVSHTHRLKNRIPDQISIINQELERTDEFNPAMRTLLEQQRESLLFRMMMGINVSALMARKMIAVSENYPGGIKWLTLKRASPYLTLDERGDLTVKISKVDWAYGLLLMVVAIGCLLMVPVISYLLQYTAKASTLAISLGLIVWSGAGMIFSVYSLAQILSARRVAHHMKSHPVGSTASGVIRDRTADTATLIAGKRNTKIAGVGGRRGGQIGGMGGQIKDAVSSLVGDIDMDASHDRIADLAVYSADRKLQLVAEIKIRRDADAGWAAELRRNLFANEALPSDVPYFLIATPDRFFLWKHQAPTSATDDSPAPPDYTVDAKPFMSSHLDYARLDTSAPAGRPKITKGELSIALTSWFNRLCYSASAKNDLYDHALWVFESGLFEAVRGGMVKFETPV